MKVLSRKTALKYLRVTTVVRESGIFLHWLTSSSLYSGDPKAEQEAIAKVGGTEGETLPVSMRKTSPDY